MASGVEGECGHHGTPPDPDTARTSGLTTGQISEALLRLSSTLRNEVYPSLEDDIVRQVDNDWGLLQCLLSAEAISAAQNLAKTAAEPHQANQQTPRSYAAVAQANIHGHQTHTVHHALSRVVGYSRQLMTYPHMDYLKGPDVMINQL